MAGVAFEDPKKRQLRAADALSEALSVRLRDLAEGGADLTSLGSAEEVADTVVSKLPIGVSPWAEIVGPCHTSGSLQRELGIGRAALSKSVRELRALRLRTSDGLNVYPAFQVSGGRLVPGLRDVLTVLRTGIDDPWTWAQWLNVPIPTVDAAAPRRHIDELIDGDLENVVRDARHTAWAWAA